jgi:phosphoribosylformylglycinamidine synthase II
VRVAPIDGDPRGRAVLDEIRATLRLDGIEDVRTVKVYRLEGINTAEADALAAQLLCERVDSRWSLNAPLFMGAKRTAEIAYKPGVMNPEAASIVAAARDLGFESLLAADSSWEYHFFGDLSEDQLQIVLDQLLMNQTVESLVDQPPATLLVSGTPAATTTIAIGSLSDPELLVLSEERQLFLDPNELRAIQAFFVAAKRDCTDAELETVAQTWSEHCSHKTFKAQLVVDGQPRPPLMERLRATASRHSRDVLSSFIDNSGVIRFFDGWALCGKVETHNSPSAIEPYGGAATGSGGVFRDIAGTGLGAKVIASTDIFCFAPLDLSLEELPPGCLHPRYLLRRAVAGVRDYGNRMGIPTANGSFHFHPSFRAKPAVIVGAYGLMPEAQCQKGRPNPGDQLVVVGGRTGRDGIHGATFSSGEMHRNTSVVNAQAVQIGNPVEEKRTLDVLLEARDRGWIRALTDCGAGGFSSAIGEMTAKSGALVHLHQAPVKYPGLSPWEVWISESQERMVLAVATEHVRGLMDLCRTRNVEATVLGEVTDDGRLTVLHHDTVVVDLPMRFLHEGQPSKTLKATRLVRAESTEASESLSPAPPPTSADGWLSAWCRVLGDGAVASKEPVVRCYDHGVQGASALPPFSGERDDGPNDAAVFTPLPDHPYGLVISHGLNPTLMDVDPYRGAIWSAVEALANFVAVGGDPERVALIDNFYWPSPEPVSLGALDQAVDACVDVADAFGLPFVSGKDSLSGTYRYSDGNLLKISPVLCISAFGPIRDASRTVTADFKLPDSEVFLVGELDADAMAGSVYLGGQRGLRGLVPLPDLRRLHDQFTALHEAIAGGHILACHDVSEGGVAATLAEMCIGGGLGAVIEMTSLGVGPSDHLFFSETPGCFLVEVAPDAVHALDGLPRRRVGKTQRELTIEVTEQGRPLCSAPVEMLRQAWQRLFREVL